MVKEPRPGRVKTRLGRDIGMVPAARWYRAQVDRLLRDLRDPRWQIVLAVAPDAAGLRSRVWPADLPRRPQGSGSLGQRMARALRSAPRGHACLIGSDVPDLTPAQIARAFAALGRSDAVFGPAPDGGYWLVGIRRPLPPRVFDGVRWSTHHALTDTLATLPNHRIAMIDTMADVDTAEDLSW